MLTAIRATTLTLLTLMTGSIGAEEFLAAGQTIRFSNPREYCTMGETQGERDVIALVQKGLSANVLLIHLAARCAELQAFRQGKRDNFDHWLQIQHLGIGGKFSRLEVPKETFLSAISKGAPQSNFAEIESQVNKNLSGTEYSITGFRSLMLGRDQNAVYLTIQGTANAEDESRPFTAVAAATVIAGIPFNVVVYEASGKVASREQLYPTLQELLNSLQSSNP